MDTPEFLVWALEFECLIRGFQDGSDPERTERQLRAARVVSDARREERVFEGLCVDPPDGFRLDEALAVYGGVETVEHSCGDCPANALAETKTGTLAGCYGIVPLPDDPKPVHDAIERGTEQAYPNLEWSNVCVATNPRWYGLWLDSPFQAEQLFVRFRVLEAAAIENEVARRGIGQLVTGLNVAFNADCRVHVALYPRGHVEDGSWRLAAHCPHCKAPWNNAHRQQCKVCNFVGHPADDKKRKARGKRPYFPLARLLGEQAAAEFLVRYEAFRAQQPSPDRP